MLVPADETSIRDAAALLRGGGLVAFPTETVYGLGASALDARAAARIFEAKRRPSFDPLIVHIASVEMLAVVARDVPDSARVLMERFWPGPLTIVLRRSGAVPLVVTAGLQTVAVRMPSHPVARALLREAGLPVAAPSANEFGSLSSTRAEHVVASLGDRVDCILDGGPTTIGIESTILQLEPVPLLLRPGALPVEEIEAAIGPVERDATGASPSPGRVAHHYAPGTPLRIADSANVPLEERADAAYLGFATGACGYAAVRVLAPGGDPSEAAVHFFEYLHELDALGLSRIDAAPVAEVGLGLAIMDRLRRAAA
ncbi:MAG: L-threonylcarbamoyladenylate synthase [Candidatus Tyrphobacter sp.]